jgi:hypothetical protein
MRNIQISINVGISETDAQLAETDSLERMENGSFNLVLSGENEFNIDSLENALLKTSYPALRNALTEHLECYGQKKARQELQLAGNDYHIEEHPSLYQVDGEIGRFSFKTYDVFGTNKTPIFAGISMFPVRKGRQWYPTSGFKKLAVIYGAAQRSYRQTTQVLNFSRRQEKGGTPLNTLHDVTESEGLKVLDFMARKSKNILEKHGFNSQGVPEIGCATVKEIPEPTYLPHKAL